MHVVRFGNPGCICMLGPCILLGKGGGVMEYFGLNVPCMTPCVTISVTLNESTCATKTKFL